MKGFPSHFPPPLKQFNSCIFTQVMNYLLYQSGFPDGLKKSQYWDNQYSVYLDLCSTTFNIFVNTHLLLKGEEERREKKNKTAAIYIYAIYI